jgi:hypothetical protein
MPRVNYTQAAHQFRMTPSLLKWFTHRAPRRDGVKLVFDAQGTIDLANLLNFDMHLRADWGDRYVPEGIRSELEREACGVCVVCEKNEPLEEAHIERRGKEAKFYFQHPHNLALLCANCHARYDKSDPTLTFAVVRARKDLRQKRMLADVDMDIAMATAVENLIAPMRSLFSVQGLTFWNSAPGAVAAQQLAAVTGSVGTGAMRNDMAGEWLTNLSSSLAMNHPITSAKVASLLDSPAEDADVWERIRDDEGPGMCLFGDEYALVESAICPNCEQDSYEGTGEEPASVELVDGQVVVSFSTGDGGVYTPKCEHCGHSPLAYEFQRVCSYHAHQADKNRDD